MGSLKVNIVKEDTFILLEDIKVSSLGYTIIVKKGFDFDGASIPKVFWGMIGNPLTGDYKIAALIHDGLYASGILPKEVADSIFLDLMWKHGVSYIKRYSMYNAVKLFGKSSWNSNIDEFEKYKEFVNVEKVNS